ncbi:DNA methyltransferase [Oscillibacter sp.]|uniref:class I SAM-dependent DNA methyltransferase n=1 Tax=Oscillibacter sp. TaxID=1945593 RepID=UPI003395C722
MILTWEQIQANAIAFSKRWQNAKREEALAQTFEKEFLAVFGVEDVLAVGEYEYKVPLDDGHNGYIDYYWPKKIAIEFKTRGKDLNKAYSQLKDYVLHLPGADMPNLLMVCDFETIVLHHRNTGEQIQFETKDLRKYIKQFANIAGYETTRTYENQVEVNVKAAEKMAKLHDALKAHGYEGHVLEVYLVRLLFCLFADDTGIFPKDSFVNYIENSKEDGSDLSMRLAQLFEVLNLSDELRKKRTLLSPELLQFRYINGHLFADPLPFADFNDKMRLTLADCCKFDWNKISPAIFGAMFQGVMDKDQRRELGAHYTSEENILKLINPLFLDELWEEFERVKTTPALLDRFHDKIANLKFLDPACGCGNFLIITYRELRRLEFEILKMKFSQLAFAQATIGENPLENEIRVNVEQFYGIEYEDFPCQIAQVGMWLMDHQMNNAVADYLGFPFVRLPLRQSATIVNENALQIAWEDVVPKPELSYILGNPPFVGAHMMAQGSPQKREVEETFGYIKDVQDLDYVTCWYKKAAQYIQDTGIEVGFVSTNSICQGAQVPILWNVLLNDLHIYIKFAHQTFKWSNEAKGKAAVFCVIVGFSLHNREKKKLYSYETVSAEPTESVVANINPYLLSGNDCFVTAQKKPLCDVPEMKFGSQPRDGGFFVLSPEERAEILAQEPALAKVIKAYIGADEFIKGKERYCIWLHNEPFEIIKNSKILKERIAAVEKFRLKSTAKTTNAYAKVPAIFAQIAHPYSDYLIVPSVSSERRRYIPIGFMDANTIASNAVQIVPNATLYQFGILTSNVHMAWMRTVAGRLKSDYRYSKELVYNTFPWPDADEKQKAVIEAAAQAVLDERAKHPGANLRDLYEPTLMKVSGLQAVHTKLDRTVWSAYGAKWNSEAECVADLMERYQKLVSNK